MARVFIKFSRAGVIACSCVFLLFDTSNGQSYGPSQVFAHNDYVRDTPFYAAYALGVGYIEADVFLQGGQLAVAHLPHEIKPGRTLDGLYLEPLRQAVLQNNGFAYSDSLLELTLMIDLKTDGITTLDAVVKAIEKYPELITCPTLRFMISGAVPDPSRWERYPTYIFFDGRPGVDYSAGQWGRIHMISTSFGQHIKWNGQGKIPKQAARTIRSMMRDAHAQGKKFRYWGTPDFENAWKQFMALKMDVILTDNVQALVKFLETEN